MRQATGRPHGIVDADDHRDAAHPERPRAGRATRTTTAVSSSTCAPCWPRRSALRALSGAGLAGARGLLRRCTGTGASAAHSTGTATHLQRQRLGATSSGTAAVDGGARRDRRALPGRRLATAPTSSTTRASCAPTSAQLRLSTTTAEGVPLTVNLTVPTRATATRHAGAAVYLWHCDRDGQYSLYSQGVEDENYLRGVQATDAAGTATFTTIFPGCYDGRWPHIHFEVYRASPTRPARPDRQDLPDRAARGGLRGGLRDDAATRPASRNLARTSLTEDMVFGDDGGIHQLATVTGDASSGYVANLTIGV